MMKMILTFSFVLVCLSNSAAGMALPNSNTTEDPYVCIYDEKNKLRDYESYRPFPCLYAECDSHELATLYGYCEPLTCDNYVWDKDKCCPVCSDATNSDGSCIYKGKELIFEGVYEPCRECHCWSGEVYCYDYSTCGYPPCADWVYQEGTCCRVCLNGSNCEAPDGTIVPAGQSATLVNGFVCDCYKPWGGICDRPYGLPEHDRWHIYDPDYVPGGLNF